MAASISGITQIAALGNSGWTAAAVATGTQPMPFVNGATFKLDGSLFGQEQGNAGIALAPGEVYSSYYMFATAGNGIDISADNAALQFHIADRAGGISVMANASDALEVYIFTGGSVSNYHTYDVAGRTLFKPGDFVPVQAGHRAPDVAGGSPDLTDVTGIGIGFKSNVTGGQYGLSLAISQLIYWTGAVTFSDTNTDPTDFDDYAALLDRYSGNTYHGLLTRSVGSTIEFAFPIKLTARNFSTTNDITFRVDNAALQSFRDGYYSFEAEPPSGGSQTFTGSKIAGNASVARVDCTLDAAGGGGTLSCVNISVSGARNVLIDGSNTTVSGVFTDPVDVTLGDADLAITVTEGSNTNAITWNADLAAGSSITTDRDIDITFAETNLNDITLTLTASNTITVNPTTGSGTYDLSGLTTTGTVTLDNATANDTTVALVAGTSYAVVGPPTTGGGDLVVDIPATTVIFAAPNLINGTRVRLYNVTQATEIDNTVVSGGAGYSITLTLDTEYESGDVVTLLATYQSGGVAKRVFRASATLTTGNFTTSDSQFDWNNPGPNTLGIDGSTVSECATDYANVQTEVDDADNTTFKSRIAAFVVNALTTADGIRNWVDLNGNPIITYSTNTAAEFNASVAAMEVINVKAASTLSVKDSFELSWSDGVDRVSAVSGSSIIWLAPARVLLQAIGSGVTAQDKIDIAAEVMSFVTENGEEFIETTRIIRAGVAGLSSRSGAGPYTINFRDSADTKNRISATVDSNGQRTAVTVDGS